MRIAVPKPYNRRRADEPTPRTMIPLVQNEARLVNIEKLSIHVNWFVLFNDIWSQ